MILSSQASNVTRDSRTRFTIMSGSHYPTRTKQDYTGQQHFGFLVLRNIVICFTVNHRGPTDANCVIGSSLRPPVNVVRHLVQMDIHLHRPRADPWLIMVEAMARYLMKALCKDGRVQ